MLWGRVFVFIDRYGMLWIRFFIVMHACFRGEHTRRMRYDKLVRDKIEEVIHQRSPGADVITRQAVDDPEFWRKLKIKLLEEVQEFVHTENEDELKEEMIDIAEVISAIIAYKNWNIGELEALMEKKANEKGRFASRLILVEIL